MSDTWINRSPASIRSAKSWPGRNGRRSCSAKASGIPHALRRPGTPCRHRSSECRGQPRTARGPLQDRLEHRREIAGDELMTPSTSAVAVCCSSASRVSVMRRAFSIAITACAAKFSTSAISFSEKGSVPPLASGHDLAEQDVIFAQRHHRARSGCQPTQRPQVAPLDCRSRRGRRSGQCSRPRRGAGMACRMGCSRAAVPLPSIREAAHRDPAELLAVPQLKAAVGRVAQGVRLFHDRVEHRREIAGR